MDARIVQQAVEWIEQNVGERTSKQDLVREAQGSDLPTEAKSAFQELPEGEYSKENVISAVKNKMMAGVSGGGLGGMLGR